MEGAEDTPMSEPIDPASASAGQSSALPRGLSEMLARTVDALEAGGVRDEALAILRGPARRFLVLTSPAVMVPAGRAWRLGVLLLDRQGRVFATGKVTRAIEPKRGVADRSLAADRRRADELAAFRGPFAEGEVVNYGFSSIDLGLASLQTSSGPLFTDSGTVFVRRDPNLPDRGVSRLDSYLAERVRLLTEGTD